VQDFLNYFQDFQVTVDGAPIADPMQYGEHRSRSATSG
jgi:hypothetical protein